MLGSLISAAILGLTLKIVARHEADTSIPKIVLIAVVTTIATALVVNTIGLWGLPLVLAGLGWALVRFCYVTVIQSAIVCAIWLACQIALGIAFAATFGGE